MLGEGRSRGMPWLTGAGTGTRMARVVMEEEYSVMARAGARAGGGGRAGGRSGPRGVCLRVPAARPRSAAASDLHEQVARVKGGGGAGCGATPEHHLGEGRRGGSSGALLAPIDRDEKRCRRGRWRRTRRRRCRREPPPEEGGRAHGTRARGRRRVRVPRGGTEAGIAIGKCIGETIAGPGSAHRRTLSLGCTVAAAAGGGRNVHAHTARHRGWRGGGGERAVAGADGTSSASEWGPEASTRSVVDSCHGRRR